MCVASVATLTEEKAEYRPFAMRLASCLISLVTVAIRHVGGPTGLTALAMQRGIIPATIADVDSKKRYADKLELVNGIDPYEIPRSEWQENVVLLGTSMSACT